MRLKLFQGTYSDFKAERLERSRKICHEVSENYEGLFLAELDFLSSEFMLTPNHCITFQQNLRKMSNFNSLLALLSALESTPIRRLEWQKGVAEGLKEYCDLIDSSSSFRAYRQILGQTSPPCIPYMWVEQTFFLLLFSNNDLIFFQWLGTARLNIRKRWQSKLSGWCRAHNQFYETMATIKFIAEFEKIQKQVRVKISRIK